MLSESKLNFIKYHLPAILTAISIIVLSSIPNLKSPIPNKIDFGDKLLHAVEYGFFSLVMWWSLSHNRNQTIRKYSPVIALIIALSWGIIDEIYQSTVPGRMSDPFDWIADSVGACLALTVIIITTNISKNEDKNEAEA
jgi:VanZ family protein